MNNEIIAELDASGILSNRYIRGHGAAALETQGIRYGIHQDEQLSTGWLTGADGAVENACEYDAFGNLLRSHENVPNRLLYGGQQYDPEVRQYYLRARYYNPVVGRFTQEDPYRGDGLNLYAYCANNPVTYYDPSGYECEFNQQAGENAQKGNVTGSESGTASKIQEVLDVADNYNLSDDTFNNHILNRHGPNSAYGNKSHFNSEFNIKDGIDSTLRDDNFVVGPNTAGREGYIFEQTFTNPIGTNSKGNPLYTLKVVIDEAENVITAFPKK